MWLTARGINYATISRKEVSDVAVDVVALMLVSGKAHMKFHHRVHHKAPKALGTELSQRVNDAEATEAFSREKKEQGL